MVEPGDRICFAYDDHADQSTSRHLDGHAAVPSGWGQTSGLPTWPSSDHLIRGIVKVTLAAAYAIGDRRRPERRTTASDPPTRWPG